MDGTDRPGVACRESTSEELWAYRELVRALAVRDLKLRYKQAFFGVAWALIQPLTAAAIFARVVERLAHLPIMGKTRV